MGSELNPSAKQVKAARALLSWTQSTLAAEAGVATSTVADFERGERVPVANNAQAIVAAIEKQGIRFTHGGAVTGRSMRPANATPIGGDTFRWVDAEDLGQWAARRDGVGGMPELMSRLVLVSSNPTLLRFPSDESVTFAGYDGICEVPVAGAFVPAGRSVWEFGTQRRSIAAKAQEDYDKRSGDPAGEDPAATTFVFVTPHRWPGKDAWAAARRADGIWKEVQALDADNLVHWLELHAGVTDWLATRIGRRPAGIRNLEATWTEWSLATKPPLSPELVLVDRDEQAIQLRQWLMETPKIHAVQVEVADEAVAFLYAALDELPDEDKLYWMSRTVVADTVDAARDLVGLNAKLVIILTNGDPGVAARLVEAGHHVYLILDSEVSVQMGATLLRRPWKHDLERALSAMGVEEAEASRLSAAAGRSLTVLRRLMPFSPGGRPSWARAPVSRALIAAMLAGAWNRDNPLDQALVSSLAGIAYDDVEEALGPLVAALDGPVRRSGPLWKLTSLRDSWTLLASHLKVGDVDGLITAFLEVYGKERPGFDETKPNWNFNPGPPTEVSAALRRGLGEAVIALGVYPDAVSGVPDAKQRGAAAVASLLRGADERLWWSLANDFQRLAEAAPDEFLAAVETALSARPSPLDPLFRSDEGFMHPTEYLADMLWALELLCWSPDHAGRATLLLARLADADPGGKLLNRPSASLARALLPWRPQTYASAEGRLQLIDRILARLPEVGWKLLLAIAPTMHGMTHRAAMPKWRDFATPEPELITHQSLGEMYGEIGKRLIAAAGKSADRWIALLEHWAHFDLSWTVQAFAALSEAVEEMPAEGRETLREELRQFIGKHSRFPDAHWSLDEADLQPLRQLFDSLEPKDAEERHKWLFAVGMPDIGRPLDYAERRRVIDDERAKAAGEIVARLKPGELLEYAAALPRPDLLGSVLPVSGAGGDYVEQVLDLALSQDDAAHTSFANGILGRISERDGEEALRARFRSALANDKPSHYLLAIGFMLNSDPGTWKLVASAGEEVEAAYWDRLRFFPRDADPEFVAGKLLGAARGRRLLAFLAGEDEGDRNIAPELIVQALRHESTINPPAQHADDDLDGMSSYYIGKLFERLDQIPEMREDLLHLEWVYYRALEHAERPPRLLEERLASDPDFFVMLMTHLYRPAGEVAAEDEADGDTAIGGKGASKGENIVAEQAYHILQNWSRVPGSDESGLIDGAALKKWVRGARAGGSMTDRADIGDYRIGVILSAARRQPGEAWPPEPVRDVIEEIANEEIEQGVSTGLYNRRGVTTRMPTDGGNLERREAARYRDDAKAVALLWPRTAALLGRIADQYDASAVREDQRAEQQDW
jgi:DNA-binding XRE family transcriptional regulator